MRGWIQPRTPPHRSVPTPTNISSRVFDSPSRLPKRRSCALGTAFLYVWEALFRIQSAWGQFARQGSGGDVTLRGGVPPRLVVPAANAVSAAAPRPPPITPIPVLGATLQLARTRSGKSRN